MLPPGTLFDDRLVIVREVGRGATAVVFEAETTQNSEGTPQGTKVALKLFNILFLPAAGVVKKRMERELRLFSSLHHPNIVRVYWTGEAKGLAPGPVPYLVMEYLQGQTLREWIARHPAPDSSDVKDMLRYLRQVLEGLRYLHSKGIIHRDIHPANIILPSTQSDEAKIADLGLARHTDSPEYTAPWEMVGARRYQAPESLYRGIYNAQTDIFMVGASFYHAISGQFLHGECRSYPEYYRKLVEEDASPVVGQKGMCDRDGLVLSRMISSNPQHRFMCCDEILRQLRADSAVSILSSLDALDEDQRFAILFCRLKDHRGKLLRLLLEAANAYPPGIIARDFVKIADQGERVVRFLDDMALADLIQAELPGTRMTDYRFYYDFPESSDWHEDYAIAPAEKLRSALEIMLALDGSDVPSISPACDRGNPLPPVGPIKVMVYDSEDWRTRTHDFYAQWQVLLEQAKPGMIEWVNEEAASWLIRDSQCVAKILRNCCGFHAILEVGETVLVVASSQWSWGPSVRLAMNVSTALSFLAYSRLGLVRRHDSSGSNGPPFSSTAGGGNRDAQGQATL